MSLHLTMFGKVSSSVYWGCRLMMNLFCRVNGIILCRKKRYFCLSNRIRYDWAHILMWRCFLGLIHTITIKTVLKTLPLSHFVCLKLGIMQLFPVRFLPSLQEKSTSFAGLHFRFWSQCCNLSRIYRLKVRSFFCITFYITVGKAEVRPRSLTLNIVWGPNLTPKCNLLCLARDYNVTNRLID